MAKIMTFMGINGWVTTCPFEELHGNTSKLDPPLGHSYLLRDDLGLTLRPESPLLSGYGCHWRVWGNVLIQSLLGLCSYSDFLGFDTSFPLISTFNLIHLFKFCWRPPSNTIAFMSHTLVYTCLYMTLCFTNFFPTPDALCAPRELHLRLCFSPLPGLKPLPGPSLLLLTPAGFALASCCCCPLRIWKVPPTGHRSPAAAFPALLLPPGPAIVLHPSSQWSQSYPGSVNNKPPWLWGLFTILLPFSFFFF